MTAPAPTDARPGTADTIPTFAEIVGIHGQPTDGGIRGDAASAQAACRMAAERHVARANDIVAAVEQRGDGALTASEQRALDAHGSEARLLRAAIEAYGARQARHAASQAGADAEWRAHPAGAGYFGSGARTSSETYHRGATSPSFFKDLRAAQLGDADAADRLRRNNAERAETRALGNTGGVGGSGGDFAPPGWITDEFVAMARPGRVLADLFHRETLPPGVSNISIPKVLTGTTAAVQSTQNTALSQTDLTTNALTSNIVTIGGKQVVSQQLLDQSGIEFDRLIVEDLAADYARQFGVQVISGSGTAGQLKGYLTATSTSAVTWTQANPTPSLFYSQLGKLQSTIFANRFAAPDTVVMTPTRWAWLASWTDGNGRPLVVPTAGGFNSLASPDAPTAGGKAGELLGLEVFVDPNLPSNLGAGTNQDPVLMFKRDDIWLWESDLRAEAFSAPYADSAGVLFRVLGYAALVPDRYPSSLGRLTGTGLVAPSFAG